MQWITLEQRLIITKFLPVPIENILAGNFIPSTGSSSSKNNRSKFPRHVLLCGIYQFPLEYCIPVLYANSSRSVTRGHHVLDLHENLAQSWTYYQTRRRRHLEDINSKTNLRSIIIFRPIYMTCDIKFLEVIRYFRFCIMQQESNNIKTPSKSKAFRLHKTRI